jgi:D-xylose transport system permease protein
MQGNIVSVISKSFKQNIRSYILIIALAVIWLGFGIAKPRYLSPDHISNVLTQMAIIGIMACGMVFVIVTGGIDLSVGYGAGFVSVIAAGLLYAGISENIVKSILPGLSPDDVNMAAMILTVLISFTVGIVMGLFQGSIIAFLKVPAFIVTLGGMFIFKSGILIVTQGKSLFISGKSPFKFISQGQIPEVAGYILAAIVALILFTAVFIGRARKQRYGIELKSLGVDLAKAGVMSLLVFGYVAIVNQAGGVYLLVIILAIIATLMSYVSKNTRFGRYAYAIGGNREAARLSGIDIKKQIFMIFVTMGTLAGVSGIALAAYVGSGTTGAGGGYELDVIASCILGGTSTLGGEGTVFGAIIGALIMQSLSNGLQMLNVDSNYQYLIKGLVLILAVWADISMKKKKA